jgi:hypothetical protein
MTTLYVLVVVNKSFLSPNMLFCNLYDKMAKVACIMQSKISKRAWVLHECMERVSDNVDAMRELLQYGLRGTELEVLVAIGKHTDTGKFMVPDDLVEDEGIDDDAETTADEADISVKEKMKRDELLKEIDPTRLHSQ